jgi:putative heme-binding domain-containing protein
MIRKKNGQIVTGRVGNLQGANVSVIEDMFAPGTMTSVRQQDIDAIKPSPVSMMPQGLLDSLKEEEIQDLAAYLISGGDPNHAAFR